MSSAPASQAVERSLTVRIQGMHPGQAEVLASRARFRVVNAGRRFGKSRVGAAAALETALSGGRVWWVAPTAKLARIGWRDLRRMSAKIPSRRLRLGEQLIELPGGGSVQVRTAGEPGGLRGEGLDGVVYDEAAFGSEESWTEELRPALSDRVGWALFISTPKGRNWFYRLWLKGQEPGGDWQSWTFPTAANPHIDPAEIEAAREELLEAVFEQEYLGRFIDAGSSPFRPEDIDAMQVGWRGLELPERGRRYLTAWDIGRRGDPTVGITVDFSREPYTVCAFERVHRVPYPELQRMIEERARAYQGRTYVESNGPGDPVIENLRIRATPHVTTARSKTQGLQALAALLERGALRAGVPDLVRELHAYEWDDQALVQDCVMALSIAATYLPMPGRRQAEADLEPAERRRAEPELAGVRSMEW